MKKTRRGKVMFREKRQEHVSLTHLLFIISLLDDLSFSLADWYPNSFPCLWNPLPSVAWEEAGLLGEDERTMSPFRKTPMTENNQPLASSASPGYGEKTSSWLNSFGEYFGGILGQDICIYMEIRSSTLDSGSKVHWFLSVACKGMNGSL